MGNYCEISIPAKDEALREVLIACLVEIGYEGFEESDSTLKAYIPETGFLPNDLNILLNSYNLTYSQLVIKKQNRIQKPP